LFLRPAEHRFDDRKLPLLSHDCRGFQQRLDVGSQARNALRNDVLEHPRHCGALRWRQQPPGFIVGQHPYSTSRTSQMEIAAIFYCCLQLQRIAWLEAC
jgi:hypothetical protein